ncbi:MAG: xanthine dehydrogenase family protein subunit M [Candidatus Limnocylindrales bacterium]
MIPAAFDYVRPGSVEEAAQAAGQPGAKVIAGGQSLLSLMKLRLARPTTLVDIGRIPGLVGTRYTEDGGAEIGAMTTYAQIMAETQLEWARDAVANIGDVQVRNRGTIGGSVAHADPASDAPAILLVLDYSAVLRSSRGERIVRLDGFFTGPFTTTVAPDEILVAVRRPRLPDGVGGAYEKLPVPASGYAIVGVAAIIARSGGSISHARVALTGVGEHPYRAKAVESALVGSDGSASAIAAAAAHATDGVAVNSDIHANAAYRSAMAVVHTRRAIEAALGRSA